MEAAHLVVTSGDFVKERTGAIRDTYRIGGKLGDGAFGSVRKITHRVTGEVRAVKTIHKKSLRTPEEQATFFNEVSVLRALDHPNILKLYEFYQDDKNYYLITEFCAGGELYDRIINAGSFSEAVAANVMRQILSCVMFSHSKGVVHRDLKPENFLFESSSPTAPIKVIDFGTAQFFTPGQVLTAKFGTPYYIAPEVLSGSYDQKCDIWSCGIILYILLTGRAPYLTASSAEVLREVAVGNVDLEAAEISPRARDLLKRMLSVSLKDRLTAAQALADPWLTSHASPSLDSPALLTTFKRLRDFSNTLRLKDAIHTYIATQMMCQEDMNRMAETFQAMDVDGDGRLSRQELVYVYRETVGAVAAEEEVKKIMQNADTDGNGYIDFTEFMKASLDRTKHLCLDNLKTAFETFDQDGNGTISLDELKFTLQSDQESDFELRELIREVDLDGDGEISWKEFATAFQPTATACTESK